MTAGRKQAGQFAQVRDMATATIDAAASKAIAELRAMSIRNRRSLGQRVAPHFDKKSAWIMWGFLVCSALVSKIGEMV